MKQAKQIVYRYNGDEKTDEEEFDEDGTVPVPTNGPIMTRKGLRWKVVQVNTEQSITNRRQVGAFMKVNLQWEFSDEDLMAVANHLGKEWVDDDDVRDFMREVMREAMARVDVEHEAAENDPSTPVGP